MLIARSLRALLVVLVLVLAGCTTPEGGGNVGESVEDRDDEDAGSEDALSGPGDDAADGSDANESVNASVRPTVNALRALDVQLEVVAEDVNRPLFVTHAPDDAERLFIVGKTGLVYLLNDGTLTDTPFADLTDRVQWGGEQGLLGLAFHPDYAANGRLFMSYTTHGNAVILEEFRVDPQDPDRVDRESGRVLLEVPKSDTTHNGGMLAFGGDGYLYFSLGDGGGAGDPQFNGQDPRTIEGAILRLDVDDVPENATYGIPPDNPFADGGDGAPEVWDYGLRNPWRFSFDRATGDLWIADVGQNKVEEVNLHPAGEPGGLNFGWSIYEGSQAYRGHAASEPVTFPVHEYSHEEGCSVAGGYVYRGDAIPELRGAYLFSDLCTGTVWALTLAANGTAWERVTLVESEHLIVSFGEDVHGELYVVHHKEDGLVMKLVPA